MCGEEELDYFLEHGRMEEAQIREMIAGRRIFPCYFGSALRLEGVEELLRGVRRFTEKPEYRTEFSARVYKIPGTPPGTG